MNELQQGAEEQARELRAAQAKQLRLARMLADLTAKHEHEHAEAESRLVVKSREVEDLRAQMDASGEAFDKASRDADERIRVLQVRVCSCGRRRWRRKRRRDLAGRQIDWIAPSQPYNTYICNTMRQVEVAEASKALLAGEQKCSDFEKELLDQAARLESALIRNRGLDKALQVMYGLSGGRRLDLHVEILALIPNLNVDARTHAGCHHRQGLRGSQGVCVCMCMFVYSRICKFPSSAIGDSSNV